MAGPDYQPRHKPIADLLCLNGILNPGALKVNKFILNYRLKSINREVNRVIIKKTLNILKAKIYKKRCCAIEHDIYHTG
jgi:hypothetical protein